MYEQDGELRKKGLFRFYVYDNLGRLVIQGTTSTCNLSSTDASATMGYSPGFLQTGYALNNSVGSTANLEIVNYYDTYDFLQMPYLAPLVSFMRRGVPSKLPISLKTGCIQFTSHGSVVPQAFYYNERGLVEEEYCAYPNNTFVRKGYIYSFTGQVKMENVELSRGSQSYTYKILSDYYPYSDKIGRIEIILPDNTKRLISEYVYDEIGRLRNMKRGGAVGGIQYSYNTRGWLTQIHSGTFSENLYYVNTNVAAPCFNGNVSSMTWLTSNDKVLRGYSFLYDNLNRLTASIYGEGQNLQSNANRYSEAVQHYDANGSPLALKRYGKKNDGTYGLIDDLHYAMRGNQVYSVTDGAERLLYPESFDFKQTSGAAYDYDANGALDYDPNKGLRIVYDHCGYPQVLEFENGNRTIFEYAQNGAKLSVIHQTGLSTTVSTEAEGASLAGQSTIVSKTEYVGNVIFEQGNISKILFNDGYYQFSDNQCHYFVKDHLGSVRTVVNEKGALEQVTHYYPLGGYFGDAGYNAGLQDFKYNGKELDRMHGLAWYDYGARSYDPILGRWLSVDPLCEKYYSWSPYVFCADNPINIIDPNGKELFLSGSYEERMEILTCLQMLTNDNLLMNRKTGQVFLSGKPRWGNRNKDLSVGTALIRDTINDKHTLTIRVGDGDNKEESIPSHTKNANDKGSDALVTFNPSRRTSLGVAGKNGNCEEEFNFPHLALGHEIIHGIRDMKGHTASMDDTRYMLKNFNGEYIEKNDPEEELITTGIIGNYKYTDNKIRREHGFSIRIKY